MEMKPCEEHQEQQQEQEKQQEEQHFHVLAVDDSVLDRKLLEKLLRVSSYHVTCVESGDKALEYLGLLNNFEENDDSSSSSFSYQSTQKQEGRRVNLIMTDYCMPGITGYDLLKRIKGSFWKDVPVVVMSSENIPSRIRMCLEGGAEEFLLKPLRLSDVKKLQNHLHNKGKEEIDIDKSIDKSNPNDNNNNNNKRKVMPPESPPPLPERRSKMKGMAVV